MSFAPHGVASADDALSAVWTIHTDVFEGPLDLLLYLVERDGIDLRALSISRITEAYLGYLDRMRELNLSLAAEYLVMAATLVHLKSLELLPRPPAILADEPDPRERLAAQLAAYAKARAGADGLDGRPMLGRETFAREPLVVGRAAAGVASPIDAFGLLDMYHGLLVGRKRAEAVMEMASEGPNMAVACGRALEVIRALGGRAELGFLLRALHTRAERVITFIGVLEMARMRWVAMVQETHLGEVTLTLLDKADGADLAALEGFVGAPA